MKQKSVTPRKSVYAKNVELASQIRNLFDSYQIKSFNVMGSIGSGKTSLLEQFTKRLSPSVPILVINGDLATTIDADRIKKAGAETIQINTGTGCHLDAKWIKKILDDGSLLPDQLRPFEGGLVFIENVGNLICPASWDVGAHLNIVVTSMTEGPYHVKKHPIIFKISQVAIINKIDFAEAMEFEPDNLKEDALAINPKIRVFLTSCKTNQGIKEVIEYLINNKS